MAQLIAIGAQVPGLSDQFHSCQHRVLPYGRQQAGQGVEVLIQDRVTAQCGGQIKAETIYAKGLHPPPQAVHDQLNRTRLC